MKILKAVEDALLAAVQMQEGVLEENQIENILEQVELRERGVFPDVLWTSSPTLRSFTFLCRHPNSQGYAIYLNESNQEPIRVYKDLTGYHTTKLAAITHGLQYSQRQVSYWEGEDARFKSSNQEA